MSNSIAVLIMAVMFAYSTCIHALSLALVQAVFGLHTGSTLVMALLFGALRTTGSAFTKSRNFETLLGNHDSSPVQSLPYLVSTVLVGMAALALTGGILGFAVPLLLAVCFTLVMYFVDYYLLG